MRPLRARGGGRTWASFPTRLAQATFRPEGRCPVSRKAPRRPGRSHVCPLRNAELLSCEALVGPRSTFAKVGGRWAVFASREELRSRGVADVVRPELGATHRRTRHSPVGTRSCPSSAARRSRSVRSLQCALRTAGLRTTRSRGPHRTSPRFRRPPPPHSAPSASSAPSPSLKVAKGYGRQP